MIRLSDKELFNAIERDDVEEVRSLIECGANPRANGVDGGTPLHKAAQRGSVEIVNILLSAKIAVDIEAKDKNGCTPLHDASLCKHVEVIKLLLGKGANREAKNNQEETPLHIASQCGHVKVARMLLNAGADVEVKNSKGETPFHFATQSSNRMFDAFMQNSQFHVTDKLLIDSHTQGLARPLAIGPIETLVEMYQMTPDEDKPQLLKKVVSEVVEYRIGRIRALLEHEGFNPGYIEQHRAAIDQNVRAVFLNLESVGLVNNNHNNNNGNGK